MTTIVTKRALGGKPSGPFDAKNRLQLIAVQKISPQRDAIVISLYVLRLSINDTQKTGSIASRRRVQLAPNKELDHASHRSQRFHLN